MQTTTDRRSPNQVHKDTLPPLDRAIKALRDALKAQQTKDGEYEAAGQIAESIQYVEAIRDMCQRYSEIPY